MDRDSTCIYCGKNANSNEHIFPASLGGRLMAKILCVSCNTSAGRLDQVISEQLAIFNSLIGTHGRDNREKYAQINASDGGTFLIDKYGDIQPGAININLPIGELNNGDEVRVSGSPDGIEKWLKAMNRKGIKININSRREHIEYKPKPMDFEFNFGGEAGLREVARIALNFLAYLYPLLARHGALTDFKSFVLGETEGSDRFIAFKYLSLLMNFPDNRFEFGHRIIIFLSEDQQEAFANVSFFSSIEFLIRFGHVPVKSSVMNVIDIDPLENHVPRQFFQHGELPISIQRDSFQMTVLQNEYYDELDSRMNKLFAKAFARVNTSIIDRLSLDIERVMSQSTDPDLLFEGIAETLNKHRQLMLIQLQKVSRVLGDIVARNPATAQYEQLFLICAQSDSLEKNGVTKLTNYCIETLKDRFAEIIINQAQKGELSRDWLKSLLFLLPSDTSSPLQAPVGFDICEQVVTGTLKQSLGVQNYLRIIAIALGKEC